MAKVLIYHGDMLERELDPEQRDWRIGRGTGNDIVLADPTKSVSRFHAELRFEQGQYYLLDLNSQNGSWVEGRRITREPLGPGTTVLFGEYRLVFEAPQPVAAPAAAAPASAPSGEVSTARMADGPPPSTPDTIRTPGAASAAARAATPTSPTSAAASARPAAKRPAAKPGADGGLVLRLVRMPKPILFGGFLAICLLVIIAGRLLRPSSPAPATTTPTTATQQPVAPPPDSNLGIIARHLKDGRAAMEAGNCDAAIREHFDRILLIDSAHAETTELKARCEETLARAVAADPNTAGAPGTPGGATSPPGAAGTASSGSAPGGQAGTGPASTRPTTATSGTRGVRARGAEATKAAAALARYAPIRAALAKNDFASARTAALALLNQTPGDTQAQTLLGQAQAGLRQAAAADFDAGKKAGQAGEWSDAVQAYERARAADPSFDGLQSALANAREKRRQAGEDAYNRARQYHSLGRLPEAIAWYERAVRSLPSDDARHGTAVARLAELKKQENP